MKMQLDQWSAGSPYDPQRKSRALAHCDAAIALVLVCDI